MAGLISLLRSVSARGIIGLVLVGLLATGCVLALSTLAALGAELDEPAPAATPTPTSPAPAVLPANLTLQQVWLCAMGVGCLYIVLSLLTLEAWIRAAKGALLVAAATLLAGLMLLLFDRWSTQASPLLPPWAFGLAGATAAGILLALAHRLSSAAAMNTHFGPAASETRSRAYECTLCGSRLDPENPVCARCDADLEAAMAPWSGEPPAAR